MNLVTCESIAAITLHLRDLGDGEPCYGGYRSKPQALCGAAVAWDTRRPISAARCKTCLEHLKRMRGSE